MLAHPLKLVGGHSQRCHKEPYRIASATFRKQRFKLSPVCLPGVTGSLISVVWRLVHRKSLDLARKRDGRFHRQGCAGGNTGYERRSACSVDKGLDVFNFALNRIRRCIRAVAASSPIIVHHGEVLRLEWECRELGGL